MNSVTNCAQLVYFVITKACFKRRISHAPNTMIMSKFYCTTSFALYSAHEKCDV